MHFLGKKLFHWQIRRIWNRHELSLLNSVGKILGRCPHIFVPEKQDGWKAGCSRVYTNTFASKTTQIFSAWSCCTTQRRTKTENTAFPGNRLNVGKGCVFVEKRNVCYAARAQSVCSKLVYPIEELWKIVRMVQRQNIEQLLKTLLT